MYLWACSNTIPIYFNTNKTTTIISLKLLYYLKGLKVQKRFGFLLTIVFICTSYIPYLWSLILLSLKLCLVVVFLVNVSTPQRLTGQQNHHMMKFNDAFSFRNLHPRMEDINKWNFISRSPRISALFTAIHLMCCACV